MICIDCMHGQCTRPGHAFRWDDLEVGRDNILPWKTMVAIALLAVILSAIL